MDRGPALSEEDFAQIARDFKLPPSDLVHEPAMVAAKTKVREHTQHA